MNKRVCKEDQIKLIMNAAKAAYPITNGVNRMVFILVHSTIGSVNSRKVDIHYQILKRTLK